MGDAEAMAVSIVNIINTNPFDVSQQRMRALDFSEYNIGRQYQGLITKIIGDKRIT